VANEESATTHFAAKKLIEQYLNEKVMQMLSRVFTDDSIMVKIDATLNYDEMQRELVKPQHDGLITHEKETQHSTNISKADKKPSTPDFTREKSYEFGREKERFTRANGTIERLTISVVLPRQTDKEKISQVERLVKSVVGFDAKRGDTISVEALIARHETEALPEVTKASESSSSPKFLVTISSAGVAFLFLISLFLRFQHRGRQRQLLLIELSQWLTEHD